MQTCLCEMRHRGPDAPSANVLLFHPVHAAPQHLRRPLRPNLPLQLPQRPQHLIQHLRAPPRRQFPVGGPWLPRLSVAPIRLHGPARLVAEHHLVVDARRADVGPRAGGEEARLAAGAPVGAVDADAGEGVDGEVAGA
ncbi:hypothetical protein TCAP_02669 [Tolypocladium capitatum]|uniref:Uncharacterized protein n=1 Tax=Tolypocladium capitatum TaxID=45235 RepID=A0A2K3QIN1_9HYPO|nr:hypothetical protein TCAP_02669 [Tolypocladium capitatum]